MKHLIRTVSWRFRDVTSFYPELNGTNLSIHSPQDAFKMFSFLFKNQVKERFIVFWLNSANRILGFEVVTEGILNSCPSSKPFGHNPA